MMTRAAAGSLSNSKATPHVPKVGVISLGCPKAVVDLERLLNQMRAEGYMTVKDYQDADVVLVNSCGFIDSAKAETLSAVGEAIAENGRVIVTGCMGAKPEELLAVHPKILAVSGPNDVSGAMEGLRKALPPRHDPRFDLVPPQGIKLTPDHYAYLKISEGCNNSCRFCIIPQFRGKLQSRPASNIMLEAERLVDAGVKELLVVSQDTGAYGVDIGYGQSDYRGQKIRAHIQDLCKALGQLDAWVRLHYVYPYPHIDALTPLMEAGDILPYLDVPFQHASPKVLKAMRRPADQEKLIRRIETWRANCPDLAIRSTFIVGYPGEEESDFNFLLDWLDEAKLDHIGAFAYSPVEGAPANDLDGQLPDEIRQDRLARFMEKAASLSYAKLAARVGTDAAVLIDGTDENGNLIGHASFQSPEVDGKIIFKGPYKIGPDLQIGDVVVAKITGHDEYDLFANLVG